MAKDSNLWAFRAPEPLNTVLYDFKDTEIRDKSSTVKYLVTLGLEAHKAKLIKQEKKK